MVTRWHKVTTSKLRGESGKSYLEKRPLLFDELNTATRCNCGKRCKGFELSAGEWCKVHSKIVSFLLSGEKQDSAQMPLSTLRVHLPRSKHVPEPLQCPTLLMPMLSHSETAATPTTIEPFCQPSSNVTPSQRAPKQDACTPSSCPRCTDIIATTVKSCYNETDGTRKKSCWSRNSLWRNLPQHPPRGKKNGPVHYPHHWAHNTISRKRSDAQSHHVYSDNKRPGGLCKQRVE